MAADCQLEPTGENYIGIRYKALLVEDELSETHWVLLFGGSGFTMNREYQPHFIDLMIKGSWAALHDDELCANGFPPVQETWDNFTIEFGLSDYEDWSVQDNDIGAWTRDPSIFPRRYTNIDGRDPNAADKIMAEYQVDEGGTLEGREIEVSFVREEVTKLPQNENYFMDPDLEGEQLCKPNSQDDILYRHWIATLKVPSLGINSSVDFYINASQGAKINGNNTLNFMWENPGRPVIESDKYKVIIFDPEIKTISGEWRKATRFLVDLRTPEDELPLNEKGELVGGYRKVNYKGRPAIEASFGYGYTDYVIDGDPTNYEPTDATKAVIDLRHPDGGCILFDEAQYTQLTGNLANFTDLIRKEGYTAERLTDGPITFDLLKNYKVLIIGWSSETFSNSEIDAIVNFVENGGGLLLMAEGWSWEGDIDELPLNQIAARLNYIINNDVITGEWIEPGHVISLLTDIRTHPVTANVSAVHVVSGSSITGSGASEVVLSDDGKAVVIAGESGKGRFVFIGDSDVFSNIEYDRDEIIPLNEADNEQLGKNAINWLATPTQRFDTGTGTYPSIMGTHNGTITPNETITVQKLYTYPCEGTGGHSEYARIWNSTGFNATAIWNGYKDDWHNISFDRTFTLIANETYNYTIRTGSYPQIIHEQNYTTLDGSFINCTQFIDANGRKYNNWIPAVRLWS
ncbi:MAG: DUF4350 domain-containing protein [archaeon]|nr:DUF4350 domain-containing protein [archaeon]